MNFDQFFFVMFNHGLAIGWPDTRTCLWKKLNPTNHWPLNMNKNRSGFCLTIFEWNFQFRFTVYISPLRCSRKIFRPLMDEILWIWDATVAGLTLHYSACSTSSSSPDLQDPTWHSAVVWFAKITSNNKAIKEIIRINRIAPQK